MPAQTVIKLRRGTAAQWNSTNPVLAAGEIGLETDTLRTKYGNGTSTWTALSYSVADASGTSSVDWTSILNKPSTFPPSAHTHPISDVTDLQTTLDGKAASVHTHAISDVTSLQTALDAKAPLASPTFTGTVSGITKSMVGLGNVDNTSDANKPISTATQAALDLKANIANPIFTGSVSGNASVSSTAADGAKAIGFKGLPASGAGATGAYTLTASDAGEMVYTTTSRTVTIPSNASVPFEIGTSIVFISGAGATTTIAITSDTMLLAGTGATGSRTLAAHGMATAVKVAATTWYISGNGLT